MTRALLPPGSLLAERFRVTSDQLGDELRVIDARDERSAAQQRVRVIVVETPLGAAEIESAVRRSQRYAVGVSGHAELLAVFALEPGRVALAYAVGDARLLDEGSELADSELAAGVERALGPLHEQGMAHGGLRRELVGRTSDGGVIVLGFGLAQALGRAAAPSSDRSAISALSGQPATEPSVVPEPPAEIAPEPASEPAPLANAPPLPAPPLRTTISEAPARSRWLGPLLLVVGALVMIAGVATTYVFARRLPPAPGATLPAPALPAPPPATIMPLPPPQPEASEAAPVAPPAVAHDGSEHRAPLSPPVRSSAPAPHADALVPVEAQPTWGPAQAPVTVTLFADLECPHTRALLPVLLRLKTELGDDLRWVFRHRPLSQHAEGEQAARLLAAVFEELGPGVFWKLVSELGADPESPAPELIAEWLEKSGIDAARRAELEALPAARARVEADLALGAQLFVRATPALFVNGRRLEGFQPQSALAAAVGRERQAGLFALLGGTPADEIYVQRTRRNLINVGDDPPERACVLEHGAPARGPANAPLTIVHFCAYESAYCQQAEPSLAALLARHPRDVRIVWHDFPIVPDGDGRTAANFALAARKAGGDRAFWLVHRALLDARAAVEAPALGKVVKELGMDANVLLSAARSREHDQSIKADIELGKKLAVSGVPTSFINGRRKDGLLSAAELEALVAEELPLARRVAQAGRGSVSELVCAARGAR